jgi:2-polyprenyl-3-methyl-5-hydroxy-6-metoxy-1,4-benzoquinol methylase
MSQYQCPICNSNGNFAQIFTTNPTEAAGHFIKSSYEENRMALRDQIKILWKSDECVILKCLGCKSRFAHPHIAGDAKFYNLVESMPIYPASRWEFDLTRPAAFQLLEEGDRLLEIGGGSGNFIKGLLRLGLDPKSVVVTEFSSHAISELRDLGVNVVSVNFRLGVEGGPFKVVVLFQTMEHLDCLDDVVNSLDDLTTPGSHAFVSVPNVEYLEWAELTLGEVDMPPNHISGFSLGGLVGLFTRHGWELEWFELQTRDTLIARCKFGAMRGLQYPKNRLQRLLRKFLNLEFRRHGRVRLLLLAGIILLTDWSLLKKTPAENILIHVKRNS